MACGQKKNKSEGRGKRRGGIRGYGGAVLGGIGKTDHAGGGGRGESRCENAARRRVQAADFAVRFSGDGRGRLEAAEKGERSDGARDYHGSDERPRRGINREIRGRDAGGRAKHAEFHAAKSAWKMRPAGTAETRIEQHGERIADVRGIYNGARECRRDFVRAGNSHI